MYLLYCILITMILYECFDFTTLYGFFLCPMSHIGAINFQQSSIFSVIIGRKSDLYNSKKIVTVILIIGKSDNNKREGKWWTLTMQ